MMKDQAVSDTVMELQTVMLDVLQRRAVFEAMEDKAMGKVASEDLALRILGTDYLRSQLSDLRKFFETDERSHRISDLTAKLSSISPAKKKHSTLQKRWKTQYEQVANQYLLHRQRGYTPPAGFSKADFDRFINDINLFLDELVRELTEAQYEVAYLSRDTTYLQEIKADAHKFFSSLN